MTFRDGDRRRKKNETWSCYWFDLFLAAACSTSASGHAFSGFREGTSVSAHMSTGVQMCTAISFRRGTVMGPNAYSTATAIGPTTSSTATAMGSIAPSTATAMGTTPDASSMVTTTDARLWRLLATDLDTLRLPVGQRLLLNSSYSNRNVFRARNGMAALARTPVLPEGTPVGALPALRTRSGQNPPSARQHSGVVLQPSLGPFPSTPRP